MRILVLANLFPPHAYGGYELWCRDVVRRWRRAGHQVCVLTSAVTLPAGDGREEDGVEVRRVLQLYWDDHEILDPPPWRRVRWERANQRHLDRVLAEFRPEVASAWAMGAMSLGLLTRLAEKSVPLVTVICDEWPVYGPVVDAWSRLVARRPALGSLARALTGLPGRLPDLDGDGPACFISELTRDKVRRQSPWAFPQAEIVPAGIDLAELRAGAPACRPPWRWRLLHVGRVDRRKGLSTVIEALAFCPAQATLDLLGSGDPVHLSELRSLAGRLGLSARVAFGDAEAQPQPFRATAAGTRELAARYGGADAVVFAPLWDEPFGLVPLEAMACGTPVVASAAGGSAEFLSDEENCLVFPPGDAAALAAALVRLAEDEDLRRHVVDNGHRTAARFDADRLAAHLEQRHRRARTVGCQGRA